ncbi:hypothetical protein ACC808_37350, partial [Rhizobium ruizarguesonis]
DDEGVVAARIDLHVGTFRHVAVGALCSGRTGLMLGMRGSVEQAAAFSKSHHAKAMALADNESVRGDFKNTRFDHDGVVTT